MYEASPYLNGPYQPVDFESESECWEKLELIDGEVPREIHGYFLRNSSNPRFKPSSLYHWFDGDGFIQGIRFDHGVPFYKGNFVRTQKFVHEHKAQKSLYGGLSMPISASNVLANLWRLVKFALLGHNPLPNTSNTDVVFHNGKLISLWMLGGLAYEIDLETLETKGEYRVRDKSDHSESPCHISAHAKTNPVSGTLYAMDFVNSWRRFQRPQVVLSAIEAGSNEIRSKAFEFSGKHLLHDLAVTENYVVIPDMPAEITALGIKYRQSRGTKFGVIRSDFGEIYDPNGGEHKDILWFDDPSGCYIIHLVNAYEEGDKLIVWGLRKSRLSNNIKTAGSASELFGAYLHRWCLDLSTGRIDNDTGDSFTEQFPVSSEFPSINEKYIGRPHRYAYLPGISDAEHFRFDSLSKYDHQHNSYTTRNYPEGVYIGEVQFVPRSTNSEAEDDGWLLTVVHDVRDGKKRAYLDIYDAQNIAGTRVARLQLPIYLPIGFHTTYINKHA